MTSKLEIYNDALANCDERKLASLSEDREPRRKLDDQWDKGVRYCLEQGLWNFAMRTVAIDASDSVSPEFGYSYAFEKPSDWIRTAVLSTYATLDPPLLRYSDETGFWYADCDPLYVQFVSNDESYGLDLSLWPASFCEYVAAYLARKISKLAQRDDLIRMEKRMLDSARSKDAMNQAPGFPPRGTWASSRGGMSTTRDGR